MGPEKSQPYTTPLRWCSWEAGFLLFFCSSGSDRLRHSGAACRPTRIVDLQPRGPDGVPYGHCLGSHRLCGQKHFRLRKRPEASPPCFGFWWPLDCPLKQNNRWGGEELKQVLIKQGQVIIEEVPAPSVESGTVLVRVRSSCISASGWNQWPQGQRGAIVEKGLPVSGQRSTKAIAMVLQRGLAHTISHAQGALTSGQPTGYSAAGVVIGVGADVHDIAIGDHVACAGAQCAHHAEVINVPRNLTVRIPDGLDLEASSTVTLGAIALQVSVEPLRLLARLLSYLD